MKFLKTREYISQTILAVLLTGALSSCQSEEKSKTVTPAPSKAVEKTASGTEVTPEQPQLTQDSVRTKHNQRKLIVYYFHTTFRCHSCTMIENLTKTAVESGFTDQLKAGRVEFKIINVETPGNEHFLEDYKLYTKSVILSDVKDGKQVNWKNLDQVWTLLRDGNKFIDYVQKEIKALL